MLFWPWNFTEKRQIGYTKKWKSFIDLAISVLSYWKSMGTIGFQNFCTHSKSITILCLLTKFSVISTSTAHFLDDLILFEIYGNYIGFADFEVPTFTKTSIFFERMLVWPWNFTEKRQIGNSKKWINFRDLATSVFELFEIKW